MMSMARRSSGVAAIAVCMTALASVALAVGEIGDSDATTAHGIAMHGEPLLGPDFTHFDYVNPAAPKGGTVTMSTTGGYDTFNPFIVKGTPAVGIGLMLQTLMVSSLDEAVTYYGSLAETVTVPDDRSWVVFALNPEARWHDGVPITAEDVVWTFNALTGQGRPFYRAYYADVSLVEALDERTVKFTFGGSVNLELPLIMGQLVVLPKHYWEGRDFGSTTLEPPLGSGPYRIADFDPGRSITYERVEDWWGADLPVNRGRYNYDRITYEYYRDQDVLFEAFKSGEFDIRLENKALNWARGYDIPAVESGQIVRDAVPDADAQPMQGWAFNTRREIFADPLVREALSYLFDFEWLNRNIFFDLYARTDSYFDNSELAATGLPQGEELAILERYRGRVPDAVFEAEFRPPASDGSGSIRGNLRTALRLLREAGWETSGGVLTNAATGRPFEFEILLSSNTMERVALPFVRNLERAGIEASLRIVDASQYVNRLDSYDFEMVVLVRQQSLSPGNEQREFWGSAVADVPGGRNLMGIADPVIDELIDLVIAAPDRESLIARTRALDRVLLWGHYVIPQYHGPDTWIAYWDRFGRPPAPPRYGGPQSLTNWWVDPDRAAALVAAGGPER